jgi:hypothetical protein
MQETVFCQSLNQLGKFCYTAKRLDKLEKVKGDFKCIINFFFKKAIKIEGSIELKNAAVYTGNIKLANIRRLIAVNHQYQVDFRKTEFLT